MRLGLPEPGTDGTTSFADSAVCLDIAVPFAVAAQALLTQSGFPSHVEIGVAKDKDDLQRLQAHAWVVCHGQVVLGGQQPNDYNSMVVWE